MHAYEAIENFFPSSITEKLFWINQIWTKFQSQIAPRKIEMSLDNILSSLQADRVSTESAICSSQTSVVILLLLGNDSYTWQLIFHSLTYSNFILLSPIKTEFETFKNVAFWKRTSITSSSFISTNYFHNDEKLSEQFLYKRSSNTFSCYQHFGSSYSNTSQVLFCPFYPFCCRRRINCAGN